MLIQRIAGILLLPLISSILYIIAAILTGLNGIIVLVISSILYCVVIYYSCKSVRKLDILLKGTISFIYNLLLSCLMWKYELFYKIFVSVHSEYGSPNAGSGLGVVISLALNFLLLFAIVIILLCSKSNEK